VGPVATLDEALPAEPLPAASALGEHTEAWREALRG
jgi:hypothetical protein